MAARAQLRLLRHEEALHLVERRHPPPQAHASERRGHPPRRGQEHCQAQARRALAAHRAARLGLGLGLGLGGETDVLGGWHKLRQALQPPLRRLAQLLPMALVFSVAANLLELPVLVDA